MLRHKTFIIGRKFIYNRVFFINNFIYNLFNQIATFYMVYTSHALDSFNLYDRSAML